MIYNVNTLQDLLYKDIASGHHQVVTHEKGEEVTLQVEIVNYTEDFTCNTPDSIGDTIADHRMLIVKFHKNLTIPYGITFRPRVRKRGMLILCLGVLTNNGIISMTARGAIAVGQNIYIARNNNILFNVSATGGTGGQPACAISGSQPSGYTGQNGLNGIGKSSTIQITGGGGSGGAYTPWSYTTYSGGGGAGTSYSGGTGGGCTTGYPSSGRFGSDGTNNGGPGGNGINWYNSYGAGGGAGNPGGSCANYQYGGTGSGANGSDGTGGLLIIFASFLQISDNAKFESNGANGGANSGGGSGGGIIDIFCSNIITKSVSDIYYATSVKGGTGASGFGSGGSGGDGSTLIIDRVNFSSFLVQVNNDIYTLNENHYGITYPTTLEELDIFKTTTDPLSLTAEEISANATYNSDNVIKAINILKKNNINNIKLLKIDK